MNEDKKSKLLHSFKSNMVVWCAIACVAMISVGIFISSIMEYHALKDAKDNVDKKVEDVQQQIDKSEHDINADMDDEYIESVAKDELGLVNPDEIIVND